METESPGRLPSREAHQRAVLFDDGLRGRSREEVKVQYTANHPVLNEGCVGARRGEEEDVSARSAEGRSGRISAPRCVVRAHLSKKTPWVWAEFVVVSNRCSRYIGCEPYLRERSEKFRVRERSPQERSTSSREGRD